MSAVLKLVDNKAKVYRSNKPVLALRFDYLHVTGKTDIHAGMVLSQLVYLYQKDIQGKVKELTVKDSDGVYWKKMTHIDWTETLGLTRQQSRSATRKLEDCGFIETKAMLYGRDKCLHYRLVCAEGDACIDGYPEFKPWTGLQETTAEVTGNQPFNTLDKTLDKEKTKGFTAKAKKPPGETKPKDLQGEEKVSEVNDVLKKFEKPVLSKKKGKFGTAGYALDWKKYLYTRTGEWQKNLSAEDVGKLGHVLRDFGEEKALQLSHFAIDNWGAFVAEATKAKGLKSSPPASPVAWFFAVHRDVLLQLIANPPKEKKPIKMASATSHKDKP